MAAGREIINGKSSWKSYGNMGNIYMYYGTGSYGNMIIMGPHSVMPGLPLTSNIKPRNNGRQKGGKRGLPLTLLMWSIYIGSGTEIY